MDYTMGMDEWNAALFQGAPVALHSLLESRERRVAHRSALLARHGAPVITVLCNMPGAIKDNPAARQVHDAAMEALGASLAAAGLRVAQREVFSLPTGPEGYFCVAAEAMALKRLCCELEQMHPCGRLFDLDVAGGDNIPLSRTALGLPARACVVCGGPAADCVSRQRHATDAVLRAIAAILAQEGQAGRADQNSMF